MSADGILEAFAIESAEILEGVESAVIDLEAGVDGALDRLYRHVHTLKGSAGIVGLDHLQAFCHAFESRLSSLRQSAAEALAMAGQAGRPKVGTGPHLGPALLACRDRAAAIMAVSSPTLGQEGGGGSGPEGLSPEEEAVLAALDRAMAEAPNETPEVQLKAEVGKEQRRSLEGYARVASSKLERILSLSSEVAISLSNLSQSARQSGDPALLDEIATLESLASTLYRAVLDTRMVPFAEVAERYRRSVEEIAQGQGRRIRFELEGADTEIEKSLADHLAEPLLHLVRNAADHGIEAPEARIAAGKDPEGVVTLGARRVSGLLSISVSDDGGGIDPEAVLAKAKARGLLAPEARPSEARILDFLFEPGFSLSSSVTRWSGRGVGLDVVKRSVENLRGSIRIASRLGQGSTATVRLPVTLSLVEGFVAWAGDLQLLVPFEAAASCLEVPGDLGQGALYSMVELEGCLLPAIDLAVLYATGPDAPPRPGTGARFAVRIDLADRQIALIVDGVGETLSAAVRPLDGRLAAAPGLAGYAIRGDGSIILVLDALELSRLAGQP